MATDLVCGVEVYEKIAAAGYNYREHIYYFCGSDCKDKFVEAPEKYIKDSRCVSAYSTK
jgi:YHS domain-containing protein